MGPLRLEPKFEPSGKWRYLPHVHLFPMVACECCSIFEGRLSIPCEEVLCPFARGEQSVPQNGAKNDLCVVKNMSWSSNVYTSATAGSWAVTGTYASTAYTTGTTGLTVNSAVLDHFVFNTVGTQTAGSAFSITVTAKDAYGNTVGLVQLLLVHVYQHHKISFFCNIKFIGAENAR